MAFLLLLDIPDIGKMSAFFRCLVDLLCVALILQSYGQICTALPASSHDHPIRLILPSNLNMLNLTRYLRPGLPPFFRRDH